MTQPKKTKEAKKVLTFEELEKKLEAKKKNRKTHHEWFERNKLKNKTKTPEQLAKQSKKQKEIRDKSTQKLSHKINRKKLAKRLVMNLLKPHNTSQERLEHGLKLNTYHTKKKKGHFNNLGLDLSLYDEKTHPYNVRHEIEAYLVWDPENIGEILTLREFFDKQYEHIEKKNLKASLYQTFEHVLSDETIESKKLPSIPYPLIETYEVPNYGVQSFSNQEELNSLLAENEAPNYGVQLLPNQEKEPTFGPIFGLGSFPSNFWGGSVSSTDKINVEDELDFFSNPTICDNTNMTK